ncbi:MAG TPA: hypothetical protein VLB79_07795 [Solirubrobacterales bacterium]|nr:hypothetical protein [Solirubrobacterales bacterium]
MAEKVIRGDGVAIVHANGSEKWYVDGKRHREGAPACVYVNGTEKWYPTASATATTVPPSSTRTAGGSGSKTV